MIETHNPKDHTLTIKEDGHWNCSCGEWGSQYLGSIYSDYCKKHKINKTTVRKWHKSHANAYVIRIG